MMDENYMERLHEENKRNNGLLCVGIFLTAVSLASLGLMIALLCQGEVSGSLKTLYVVCTISFSMGGLACATYIGYTVGCYFCPKCMYLFIPTKKSYALAPRLGFTRYMECPICGEKSWCLKSRRNIYHED